jgi:hypothetical protein
MKLKQKETPKSREARLGRERAQSKKQLPGKKGPLVFYWEKMGEFNIRIRTLLSRADAGFSWTAWSNKEKIYDSFNNQYDCCSEWSFDPEGEDTALPNDEREEESSDHEYRYHLSGRPAPVDNPPSRMDSADGVQSHGTAVSVGLPEVAPSALQADVPMSAPSSRMDSTDEVPSHDISALQTDVPMSAPSSRMDSTDGVPSHGTAIVEPVLQMKVLMDAPSSQMDSTDGDPSQEVSSMPSVPPVSQMNLTSLEEVDLAADALLTASKQDILAMYPPAPSVQPPPQIEYLDDQIYYRYGYSLSEAPYQNRLPAFVLNSTHPFRSWYHICNAVGGQGLSSSTNDRKPITDFLAALTYFARPFHDVPGKYWDLSPGNTKPLKLFSPIHFRIEVKKLQNRSQCRYIDISFW